MPTALHLLGLCLFQRGKVRESLVYFEKSVEIHTGDPGVHINHALALAALDDEAGALNSSQAGNRPPIRGIRQPITASGASLYRAQDFDGAIKAFARAVQLKPDYPEALANLGLCRIELGDLDGALAYLTASAAIAHQKRCPHVAGLGNVKALLKEYKGAITYFEKLVRLDPRNGYARAHLLQLKRQICDWQNYHADIRALTTKHADLRQDRDLPSPFIILNAIDHPRIQFDAAKAYARRMETGIKYRSDAPDGADPKSRPQDQDRLSFARFSPAPDRHSRCGFAEIA